MTAAKRRASVGGFTLIELLVVVALVSIILALAVPSFTSTLARKRLEGVASELATDLQYARSEAAQRNAAVGVVFASTCYAVYVIGSTDATNCTTLGTGAAPLKTVQITGGVSVSLAPTTGTQAFIEFDPVRGMAINATSVDRSGIVTAIHSAGTWQIQARVNKLGRVILCSPNGTISGLATGCS